MKKTYSFEAISACEMCGSPDSDSRVLGQRFNCRQGLNTHNLQGITTTVKKCRRCGLIYANPLPVPFAVSDHYDIPPDEYWGKAYLSYDLNHFAWQAKDALRLLRELSPRPRVALDIGCGIGKDIKTLTRCGFECFGIEPSPSFREKALEFTGLNHDRIKGCSIEDASFPSNSFDFISFGAVFEHLYHPALSLQRVIYWLKPGGIIHIEVPSSRWLVERIYHLILKARGSELTSYLSPMHPPFHLYSFSIESFQILSSELGLRIIEQKYHVNSALHFPHPLKGLASGLMKQSKRGMQLTVWLAKSAECE